MLDRIHIFSPFVIDPCDRKEAILAEPGIQLFPLDTKQEVSETSRMCWLPLHAGGERLCEPTLPDTPNATSAEVERTTRDRVIKRQPQLKDKQIMPLSVMSRGNIINEERGSHGKP